MSETTKPDTEAPPGKRDGVEAAAWTERMLAALVNGVRGGKWYSLMDKVYRPEVLAAAWQRVRSNKGAAGVDRISVTRFEANAQRYLEELRADLRTGHYRPQPVRRLPFHTLA